MNVSTEISQILITEMPVTSFWCFLTRGYEYLFYTAYKLQNGEDMLF